MVNSLTTWVLEHLPATLVIITTCTVVIIFIVWRLSKMWFQMKNMPCKEHDTFIKQHTGKIDDMASSLSKIEGQLSILIKLMPQMTSRVNENLLSDDAPVLSQKHSPKMLNDNGRKLYEAFDGEKFLAENKEWLIGEIEKFLPKTALDVENYSMAALRVASLDDRFNQLKDKIYHSPAFELATPDSRTKTVEVSLDDVLFVLSLPLRDAYLQAHPELAS